MSIIMPDRSMLKGAARKSALKADATRYLQTIRTIESINKHHAEVMDILLRAS